MQGIDAPHDGLTAGPPSFNVAAPAIALYRCSLHDNSRKRSEDLFCCCTHTLRSGKTNSDETHMGIFTEFLMQLLDAAVDFSALRLCITTLAPFPSRMRVCPEGLYQHCGREWHRTHWRVLRGARLSIRRIHLGISRGIVPPLTFPWNWGRFDLESSSWVSVLSGSVETARVSSAGAVAFIENSLGERYPSAECGRLVL